MSFQGRLLEVGTGEARATGEVLSRVVHTFERVAEGVIDAEVRFADGRTEVLSATPEHPFYAPEVGKYVSLRHLEVGARLHTLGGGAAVLVGKTWRQGGVEVFNLEVDGGHNFFAGGVLTHNAKNRCGGAGPNCPAGMGVVVSVVSAGLEARGRPRPLEQLSGAVKSGQNIYTPSQADAARLAGLGAEGPEVHKKDGCTMFSHFHRKGRPGGHIFFGKGR